MDRNHPGSYMEGLAQLVRARKRYRSYILYTQPVEAVVSVTSHAKRVVVSSNLTAFLHHRTSCLLFSSVSWSPSGLQTLYTLFFIFVFILFICKEKIDLFNNNILGGFYVYYKSLSI